jgi:hypothetical protein
LINAIQGLKGVSIFFENDLVLIGLDAIILKKIETPIDS